MNRFYREKVQFKYSENSYLNYLPGENQSLNMTWDMLAHLRSTSRNMPKDEIYYYHTDHLGSSSWITYTDGSPVQYLSYMPFGESQIDQRSGDWNSRYTFYPEFIEGFSGKERDEETGYSYFGARYYDPNISIWLSRDPLADKYPYQSPYVYCSNNPIKRIDPNGMADGNFHDWNGKYLGNDGKIDDNIFIVSDSKSTRTIKNNEKSGKTTDASDVNADLSTTRTVLKESVDVYNRTEENGGNNEEASSFDNNGLLTKYPTGTDKIDIDSKGDVSIHSHILNDLPNGNISTTNPSSEDRDLTGYNLNIIVGKSNCNPNIPGCLRTPEASFYNNNWNKIGTMDISVIKGIINRR